MREHVADQDTDHQRNDEARFRGQPDGPADPELGLRVGRGRDVGVGAEHEADFADEENNRERLDETSHVAAEHFDAHGKHRRHTHIGQQEGNEAGNPLLVARRRGREGIPHVRPHVGAHDPTEDILMRHVQDGQQKDKAPKNQGDFIFGHVGLCHKPTPFGKLQATDSTDAADAPLSISVAAPPHARDGTA